MATDMEAAKGQHAAKNAALTLIRGKSARVENPTERQAQQAAAWVEETRHNWRRNFARRHEPLNQPEGLNPLDVSHTRWLCPTARVDRKEFHGIRNARMQEHWAVEARQRWHEKNPKPTWREQAVDLTLVA
ncbi:unnamed protein product [Effrenium voratum]|uniref:Uncharacterized protein n=1 Tax=Effrenium voratum TaxID=2562239 RepID=A0AA36J3Q4_9DINO|nr:unnamed protein product [Effrenium voratum]CAJ1460930.1 unnamed protein product [Effrenium voratum]